MSWIDDKMELEIKKKKEIQKKKEIEIRERELSLEQSKLKESKILPYFKNICNIAASANSELELVHSSLQVSYSGSRIIIKVANAGQNTPISNSEFILEHHNDDTFNLKFANWGSNLSGTLKNILMENINKDDLIIMAGIINGAIEVEYTQSKPSYPSGICIGKDYHLFIPFRNLISPFKYFITRYKNGIFWSLIIICLLTVFVFKS